MHHSKNNKKLAVAVGVAAMAATWQAAAQDMTMRTMVVTATRMPIEQFKAAANISVITRETLEEKHYHDLGAALKNVPGVTIQNYGSTGANYSSNSLLINGSDKIVVLIDGMRANTNGSVSNRFSANELVDLSRVERIEVLKGSASTLYGSDAQGGVINIITRRVDDTKLSTTLAYAAGSYGLDKYNFRHAGSKNGFYWAVNGQRRSSGNYKDGAGNTIPEDLKDTALGLKLGKKFADGFSSIELDYSQYKSDYMRPDNLGQESFAPSLGKKDNNRISLVYVQKISEQLDNRLSVFRNTNNLRDKYNNWPKRWFMDLETAGISNQLVFRSGKHLLSGGFDYYKDKVKKYQTIMTKYTDQKEMSSTGFFIQDEWAPSPNWTLTPGVRLDRHSIYGNHTSPALSINYIAKQRTNYYASYKGYFAAPNHSQLFSSYGNKDLNPETGQSVEVGIKHQFDSTMNANVNVYTRKSEDIIVWRKTGTGSYEGKYINESKERAQGASLGLSKLFLNHYSATVGYTYTHIKAQKNSNPNRDGSIPRDVLNLDFGYVNKRFSADLTAKGNMGIRFRKADTYPNKQTNFWVLNFTANYEPYTGFKLFARVNNLFNKYYTERTYNADPKKWYPQPGRNFLVGIEYTF